MNDTGASKIFFYGMEWNKMTRNDINSLSKASIDFKIMSQILQTIQISHGKYVK